MQPKFCKTCGKPLVLRTYTKDFDEFTGKPHEFTELVCMTKGCYRNQICSHSDHDIAFFSRICRTCGLYFPRPFD